MDRYGWSFPGIKYIRFCKLSWGEKDWFNADTLMHETAHKKGVVLLRKNERYGSRECKDLAKNNPRNARENADSYALFSEFLYRGKTSS